MHIVPNVDDGAKDMSMALDMVRQAYNQGVRDIFCTSHNAYEIDEIKHYRSQLLMLQICTKSEFPDLTLYPGCELLCSGAYIEDVLRGLKIGTYLPLGTSKYVLTELYTDATPSEAKKIVGSLVSNGWKPILAHVERYPNLFDGHSIVELIGLGAKLQINLYSLAEEHNMAVRERSRYLLANHYVHFVGSDAHRSNHRPPRYEKGVQYIYENCDRDYADAICFGNATDLN